MTVSRREKLKQQFQNLEAQSKDDYTPLNDLDFLADSKEPNNFIDQNEIQSPNNIDDNINKPILEDSPLSSQEDKNITSNFTNNGNTEHQQSENTNLATANILNIDIFANVQMAIVEALNENNKKDELLQRTEQYAADFVHNKERFIQGYFTMNNELDTFCRQQAIKHNVSYYVYFNYLIIKDMNKNSVNNGQKINLDPTIINDSFYIKENAFSSRRKSLPLFPETHDYLKNYSRALGVSVNAYVSKLLKDAYNDYLYEENLSQN